MSRQHTEKCMPNKKFYESYFLPPAKVKKHTFAYISSYSIFFSLQLNYCITLSFAMVKQEMFCVSEHLHMFTPYF